MLKSNAAASGVCLYPDEGARYCQADAKHELLTALTSDRVRSVRK